MKKPSDYIIKLAIDAARETIEKLYAEERKNNPAVRTVWWFMTGENPCS